MQDIEEGMIVVSRCDLQEGAFGVIIPRGTSGMVTEIRNSGSGCSFFVEFELGETAVSRPVLCGQKNNKPKNKRVDAIPKLI